MHSSLRKDRKETFVVTAGWLFADMLLALAMLFLAANTLAIHPPPTPPRVSTHPKVTPTQIPHLEQNYHRFKIVVDPGGLLNASQSASNAVAQQVASQSFLQKRRAGLAIVYGGASSDNQIAEAENIANKVYNILHDLGKHDRIFTNISRYDPLYLLGGNPHTVTIDIFLFAQ